MVPSHYCTRRFAVITSVPTMTVLYYSAADVKNGSTISVCWNKENDEWYEGDVVYHTHKGANDGLRVRWKDIEDGEEGESTIIPHLCPFKIIKEVSHKRKNKPNTVTYGRRKKQVLADEDFDIFEFDSE